MDAQNHSVRPDPAGTVTAAPSLGARLYALTGSLPVRAVLIALKLMLVYILSQKDAAFFYQQF